VTAVRVWRWCAATAVLLWFLTLPASAQNPLQSSQPNPPAAELADPFGRDTPRGTMTGLNEAVHREDFVSAARYMQLTPAQRPNTEHLARHLTELIDRYYTEPLTTLSDAREGSTKDGLSLDRERIVLTIGGKPVDIGLVRVKDRVAHLVPDAGADSRPSRRGG
jgi:MscS family membrane protein